MLEFAYPLAFLALPLPLIAWWLLPPQRERVSALRVPFFAQVVSAAGSEAREGAVVLRRNWLQTILAVLVWFLLVTGLAKPQWVGEPIVRTEAARDVMLAIDLSGSMDYRDFPDGAGDNVSRFEAVQRVVDRFVAERESDRIGLIVFGTKAYLQLPFTRDLATAKELVQLMDVGMAGPQTALGDAIGLSIKSFENSEVDQKLLILLTDGNDTVSKMTPVNAAEIAKTSQVEIFTIGVGDPNAEGEDKVDFDVLESIASATGGEFFTAQNESGLTQVYARIDELAPGETKTQSWRPRESLVHWPVGCAVILSLIGFVIASVKKWRRTHALGVEGS